jgi:hypothetical protein
MILVVQVKHVMVAILITIKKKQQDRSPIEKLPQPMFEAQSIESPSTGRTVNSLSSLKYIIDLIELR